MFKDISPQLRMSFESEKIQWALLVSASIGWLVCLAKGLMVLEYEFTVSDINFKITDVGGQREQRTIWLEFLAVCLSLDSPTSSLLVNYIE